VWRLAFSLFRRKFPAVKTAASGARGTFRFPRCLFLAFYKMAESIIIIDYNELIGPTTPEIAAKIKAVRQGERVAQRRARGAPARHRGATEGMQRR
jgi:hypothetical protein